MKIPHIPIILTDAIEKFSPQRISEIDQYIASLPKNWNLIVFSSTIAQYNYARETGTAILLKEHEQTKPKRAIAYLSNSSIDDIEMMNNLNFFMVDCMETFGINQTVIVCSAINSALDKGLRGIIFTTIPTNTWKVVFSHAAQIILNRGVRITIKDVK